MPHSLLPDRAVVSVSGEDAESLLNRLFTNTVLGMASGQARYAALLSPQGKLMFDFLVCRTADAFWLDCRRDQAAEFVRRLTMFRLRAKAEIALRDELAVAAAWDAPLLEAPHSCFRDPRHGELGWRIIAPREDIASLGDDGATYRTHAIALGVPEGGCDWPYGDTFVHDANLDLLHGVDFGKGCYVGQEVVSRVHHRGSARKRIVRLRFRGDPPPVGTALLAGGTRLGELTSLAGHDGLASVRVDKLEEAAGVGAALTAGDTLVEVRLPTAAPLGDA